MNIFSVSKPVNHQYFAPLNNPHGIPSHTTKTRQFIMFLKPEKAT